MEFAEKCTKDSIHTKLQSRLGCVSASRSGGEGFYTRPSDWIWRIGIYIRFNSVRWSKSSDNTSNQATMASFLILFNSPFNNNLSIRRFKLQSFWTVHEWRKRTVLSRSSPATLVTAQLLSVCLTTRLLHYWRIQASLRHYSPRAPDVTAPALHDYKNTYRSLDAIVAQSKPAHLEMTVRLT